MENIAVQGAYHDPPPILQHASLLYGMLWEQELLKAPKRWRDSTSKGRELEEQAEQEEQEEPEQEEEEAEQEEQEQGEQQLEQEKQQQEEQQQ